MEKKRDFLSLFDVSDMELAMLIRRAEELRFVRQMREPHATRPGRILALIFEKASTRTRVSFEVAIEELGGHAVVLGRNDSQLGRGEPIKDTARVMARYCHGIMVRTYGHEGALELAKYASVPVINGLTDLLHPCQVLADLQTVYAHVANRETSPAGTAPDVDVLSVLRSVRYAWVGDGNNMANTWIEAAGLLGLDLALACPKNYEPSAEVWPGPRAPARAASISPTIRAKPWLAVTCCRRTCSLPWAKRPKSRRDGRPSSATAWIGNWSAPRTAKPSCSTACPRTEARKSPTRSSRGR